MCHGEKSGTKWNPSLPTPPVGTRSTASHFWLLSPDVPRREEWDGVESVPTDPTGRNAFLRILLLPGEGKSIRDLPMDAREAFVALNMIEHVGPVRVRQLLERFGDPAAILAARQDELLRVEGIGADTAAAIANWEKGV